MENRTKTIKMELKTQIKKTKAITFISLFMFSCMGLISGVNLVAHNPIGTIILIPVCIMGIVCGFYNIYKICKTDEEIKKE